MLWQVVTYLHASMKYIAKPCLKKKKKKRKEKGKRKTLTGLRTITPWVGGGPFRSVGHHGHYFVQARALRTLGLEMPACWVSPLAFKRLNQPVRDGNNQALRQ
jgi:hypothetical protein